MLAARLRASKRYDDEQVHQFLKDHEAKLAKLGQTELAVRLLRELVPQEYALSVHGPH
jgi:hypothetical protein